METQAPFVGTTKAPQPEDKPMEPEADTPEAADETPDTDTAVEAAPEVEEEVDNEEPEATSDDDEPRGYLRHADYTRKTMEVAEMRRQIEARAQALAAQEARLKPYVDWDQMLSQHPRGSEAAQRIQQVMDEYGIKPGTGAVTAVPPEFKQEIEQAKAELRELKEEQFASVVEAQAMRLAKANNLKRSQVNAVIKAAVEDGLLDFTVPKHLVGKRLEMVYKSLNFEKAEANGQKKLVTKLREGAKASGARKVATEVEAEPDFAKMSFEQIAQYETARLKREGKFK